MKADLSPARPGERAYRVALVGPMAEIDHLPIPNPYRQGSDSVSVDRVKMPSFGEYVDGLDGGLLAAVLVVSDDGSLPVPVRSLVSRPDLSRTRIYLLARAARDPASTGGDALDIEDVLDLDQLTAEELGRAIENGVRAYRALGANPLLPQYYLDATFNEIFDWFETTKWDWQEVDLSKIQRDRLRDDEAGASAGVTAFEGVAHAGQLREAHARTQEIEQAPGRKAMKSPHAATSSPRAGAALLLSVRDPLEDCQVTDSNEPAIEIKGACAGQMCQAPRDMNSDSSEQ